jgi:hypothetical protein
MEANLFWGFYEQFFSKMGRAARRVATRSLQGADGDSDALLQTVRTPELWAKVVARPAKRPQNWKTIDKWLPICVPPASCPLAIDIDLVRQDRD